VTRPLRQTPRSESPPPDAGLGTRRGAAFWAIALGVAASLLATALLMLWSLSEAREDLARESGGSSGAALPRSVDREEALDAPSSHDAARTKVPRRHEAARLVVAARSERLYAEYAEQERFAAANAARIVTYERQRQQEDRASVETLRRFWLATPDADGATRVRILPLGGHASGSPAIEYVRVEEE
jgi:hypothetical protein